MLRIETVYQTKNRCYQAAKPANHIGILVHSTGANNKNLKRYVDAPDLVGENQYDNHWNNSAADKCMHAFIGLDKSGEIMVIQTLPYDYACWGCGKGSKGSYNYNPTAHIQFEICQGSDTDADYYWEAIQAAEDYCVHLCKLFGWTADRITSHVEAHKAGYASNHSDPTSWMKNFGDDMNKFRSRVAALLDKEEDAEMVNYKVTGNRLALRAQPSTTATVLARMETGTVIKGEVTNAEWVKVSYNGMTGYSMAKYLQKIQPTHPNPPIVETPPAEPSDSEKLEILWNWYKKEVGA